MVDLGVGERGVEAGGIHAAQRSGSSCGAGAGVRICAAEFMQAMTCGLLCGERTPHTCQQRIDFGHHDRTFCAYRQVCSGRMERVKSGKVMSPNEEHDVPFRSAADGKLLARVCEMLAQSTHPSAASLDVSQWLAEWIARPQPSLDARWTYAVRIA